MVAAPVVYSDVCVGEAQVELDLTTCWSTPVVRSNTAPARGGGRGVVVADGRGGGPGLRGAAGGAAAAPARRRRAADSAGDVTVRVPPTSRDEVGELTRAFNEMGDSLEQKQRIQSGLRALRERLRADPAPRERRRRAAGRASSAKCPGPVRGHPPLHAALRGHEGPGSRGAAQRGVPAGLGPHPRARRHDRQVHRRLGDGLLRRPAAPDRPRPARRGAAIDIQRRRGRAARTRACPTHRRAREGVEVGVGIHTGVGGGRQHRLRAVAPTSPRSATP